MGEYVIMPFIILHYFDTVSGCPEYFIDTDRCRVPYHVLTFLIQAACSKFELKHLEQLLKIL